MYMASSVVVADKKETFHFKVFFLLPGFPRFRGFPRRTVGVYNSCPPIYMINELILEGKICTHYPESLSNSDREQYKKLHFCRPFFISLLENLASISL